MLTRRLAAFAIAAGLASAVTVATPAAADEEVYCPPLGGACTVIVTNPGGGGGGTGGGPDAGGDSNDCGNGRPCYRPDLGWLNLADGCYYLKADPQPPAGHPAWEGHQPNDGSVYLRSCPRPGNPTPFPDLTPVWRASPPPGYGGTTSVATLAARAVSQLPIRGPDIGLVPDPSGSGLVGLPVWMWTTVNSQTWGPASATASVPGLSVTATARAVRIVWEMGDGTAVTCASPGTAYEARFGNTASPTCGHRYTRPGTYAITATTTWHVTWAGGGSAGELDVTRQSTSTVRIGELQVVTQ